MDEFAYSLSFAGQATADHCDPRSKKALLPLRIFSPQSPKKRGTAYTVDSLIKTMRFVKNKEAVSDQLLAIKKKRRKATTN